MKTKVKRRQLCDALRAEHAALRALIETVREGAAEVEASPPLPATTMHEGFTPSYQSASVEPCEFGGRLRLRITLDDGDEGKWCAVLANRAQALALSDIIRGEAQLLPDVPCTPPAVMQTAACGVPLVTPPGTTILCARRSGHTGAHATKRHSGWLDEMAAEATLCQTSAEEEVASDESAKNTGADVDGGVAAAAVARSGRGRSRRPRSGRSGEVVTLDHPAVALGLEAGRGLGGAASASTLGHGVEAVGSVGVLVGHAPSVSPGSHCSCGAELECRAAVQCHACQARGRAIKEAIRKGVPMSDERGPDPSNPVWEAVGVSHLPDLNRRPAVYETDAAHIAHRELRERLADLASEHRNAAQHVLLRGRTEAAKLHESFAKQLEALLGVWP